MHTCTSTGPQDASEITRVLAAHDLFVNELTPDLPDLESVFLDLTRDDTLGSAPVRLLRVELDRFRSRRAIALMILTGFLLVAAMVASTVWGSRPVSDTEIAGAKQAAAQEQAAIDSDYARCLDDPTSLFPEATTAELPAW